MAYKVNIKGGSHPTLVDYKCDSCEHVQEDVFFEKRSDVTSTRACTNCDEQAHRVLFPRQQNHLHQSHSGLYGKFEPAAGRVFESYGDKKKWMRENGVQEGNDPVGGSRCHRVDDPGPRQRRGDTAWTD